MRYRLILKEQVDQPDNGQEFAKEIAMALKQAADEAAPQIQAKLKKANAANQAAAADGDNLNELDAVSVASLTLAMPAILGVIDKAVRLLKSKENKENPTMFGKASHWLHHAYITTVAVTLVNIIPGMWNATRETKKKVAEVILTIVTIKLAFVSGAHALHSLHSAHTGHAIYEGALTAVKTGEVGAFLTAEIGNILKITGVAAKLAGKV